MYQAPLDKCALNINIRFTYQYGDPGTRYVGSTIQRENDHVQEYDIREWCTHAVVLQRALQQTVIYFALGELLCVVI